LLFTATAEQGPSVQPSGSLRKSTTGRKSIGSAAVAKRLVRQSDRMPANVIQFLGEFRMRRFSRASEVNGGVVRRGRLPARPQVVSTYHRFALLRQGERTRTVNPAADGQALWTALLLRGDCGLACSPEII